MSDLATTMTFPHGGNVGAGRDFSDVGSGTEWCGKQSVAKPWALGGNGLRKKSEKERRAAGCVSKKEEWPVATERRKSRDCGWLRVWLPCWTLGLIFYNSYFVIGPWAQNIGLTIYCKDPDPPLADIVLFGLSLSGLPSRQGFQTRLLGGFHTLINNGGLFSSPTNVGHHSSPPFGAQRPRCHSFLPPVDVGPPPNPPPFGAQRPY